MASEATHEVLSRQLPPLPMRADGQPVAPAAVEVYCVESAQLIADLRQRVAELEQQVGSGADAFNRMVRLGNQAAENIVANAYIEAERIAAEAREQADSATAEPRVTSVVRTAVSGDAEEADFGQHWEEAASIDERLADRTFFEEHQYEEPSRSWILADAG